MDVLLCAPDQHLTRCFVVVCEYTVYVFSVELGCVSTPSVFKTFYLQSVNRHVDNVFILVILGVFGTFW